MRTLGRLFGIGGSWMAITLAGGCLLAACGARRLPPPPVAQLTWPAPPAASVTEASYRIGPFDRLRLRIWPYTEFSGEFLVKEDGTVFLPYAGHVTVVGLPPRRATDLLRARLAEAVVDPQLDLEPIEIRSTTYLILGGVRNPGRYPILAPTTPATAVALAGGLAPDAVLDRVYLKRHGHLYLLDLRREILGDARGPVLAKGDVLYVPTAADRRVYVLGAVRQPGDVALPPGGLGLLGVLARAGGLARGADPEAILLLRPRGGRLTTYRIDAEVLLSGEADVVPPQLEPGDVVYVPRSALGDWNELISQIAPTLETFVYRPLAAGRDYTLIQDLAR